MILNNYWNLMAGMAGLTFAWSNDTDEYDDIGLKDTNGSSLLINPHTTDQGGSSADVVANWNPRAKLSAIIGEGTTEPTASDFALGDDVTNDMSNYSVTVNTSATNGEISTVITITGMNNTAVTITISEVGIVKEITTTQGNAYTHVKKDCLLVKHLLDTPKTVAPGEGFTLTLEWLES